MNKFFKMTDGLEKCFGFLNMVYYEIPKFDNLSLENLDDNLLDEKGTEEILFGRFDENEIYRVRYIAVIKKSEYEFAIALDGNVKVRDEREKVIYEKKVPTIREQLSAAQVNMDDLLFIAIDDLCDPSHLTGKVSRSLTLYCTENVKDSEIFKSIAYNAEEALRKSEEQAILLDYIREAIDTFVF